MPNGYTDAKKAMMSRLSALRDDRNLFVPHWKEIQEFILPDHGRGLAGSANEQEDRDGSKRMSKILDGTACRGMDVMAAGFQAGLTRPSSPWFKLGLYDAELSKRHTVATWLYQVEQQLFVSLAQTAAYTTFHHTYLELGGFGIGCYGMFADYDSLVHFRPYTVGEYYLATDAKGKVNTCYRELFMTAAQCIEEFGEENCSKSIINAFKNGGQDKRFEVVHAVEPNDSRIELPKIGGKKFRSVYFEKGGEPGKLLRVSGFRSFPFVCPRWFTVGNQVYGRSQPGMRVLPDVKQLQSETRKKLEAMEKVINPPLLAPGRPTDLQVDSSPNGMTYDTTPGSSQGNGVRPLYEIQPRIEVILNDIENLRRQIQVGQFNDLFMAMIGNTYGQPMTAREVAERHEEKLLMVGPIIERCDRDMLAPTIERLFDLAQDADILPEPPEEIQGQPLKITFVGIFAQAQQMAGIGAIEQFIGFVGSMAAANPSVLDKIDFDKAAEVYGDRAGVPPTLFVDDAIVAQTRDKRAKQQAAQAAIQSGAQAAQAAKVMSETETGGNTALATLLGAMPGGMGGGQ